MRNKGFKISDNDGNNKNTNTNNNNNNKIKCKFLSCVLFICVVDFMLLTIFVEVVFIIFQHER